MTLDFLPLTLASETSPERLHHQFTLIKPERFSTFFQRVRISHPESAIGACLLHLSEHGLEGLGKQMMLWLSASDQYLSYLLDPELLSLESAKRVSALFRKADPNFFAHLSRFAFHPETSRSPALTSRALAILDELSQTDPIIPWLRQLTEHPDERIRSKAVKALCRLRPSKSTVELHLQSTDARVRANALEALWHLNSTDAITFFESALEDPHHRVVINALIGLCYRKAPGAFEMLVGLSSHSSEMFRLATVWALGELGDGRAIPVLRKLLVDPCDSVSQKAKRVLGTFGPEPSEREQAIPRAGQQGMDNPRSTGSSYLGAA